MKQTSLQAALTIAGSDSGGGAGIQADLKTFAALGVHGTSALTCITAQNPSAVTAIQPCRPEIVRRQIEAVLDAFPVRAIKTGMLFSTPIIRAVADVLRIRAADVPLVIDPVMVAGSGAQLLRGSALAALRNELLPLASLVTPNLAETALLTGVPLKTEEDLRKAARAIHDRWGCAALVKGGHFRKSSEAIDIFYDGKTELLLRAPLIRGVSTHGTGCTLSAAIAGYLALGHSLPRAVEKGKEFITQAISRSVAVGKQEVLNSFWNRVRG